MAAQTDIIDHPATTAADLKAFIERLERGGFDLASIKLTNGGGDPVGSVTLTQDETGLTVRQWLA